MGDKDKRKEELEFSARLDVEHAAEYLQQLAAGLRQGSVRFSAGGRSVYLTPADMLKIEVEVESQPEKGKGSIAVELSWKQEVTPEYGDLEIVGGASSPTPLVLPGEGGFEPGTPSNLTRGGHVPEPTDVDKSDGESGKGRSRKD